MEVATMWIATGEADPAVARFAGRTGMQYVAKVDASTFAGDYEILEVFNDQYTLPAYFGWNWDALYDCLADLAWLPADRYLLVVENAAELHPDENPAHHRLLEVLRRVISAWSSPLTNARNASVEFRVLLEAGTEADRLEREAVSSGFGVRRV